ncbi:Zinc finger CCCH domain-containing protein 45, partial [Camellia lanceoleosa]
DYWNLLMVQETKCYNLYIICYLNFLSESPSYKGNGDAYATGADVRGHNCDQVGNSCVIKKGKLYGTRYFIIKSLTHQNIQLSIEKGIWATQVMNEPILEEAFHCQHERFLSRVCSNDVFCWVETRQCLESRKWWKKSWGRSFKVKWLRLHDLPFQKTLHLKNPLNDYKPVKISRDCQELPQDIGEALCELLDGKDDTDANLHRDDIPLKRPCIEHPCALQNEECNVPVVHMTWAQAPMLYPSLLYQHETEASRFHSAHLAITSGASKVMRAKHSQINGSLANVQLDQDNSSRFDVWGWSAERSPLASTLTEDDILEMSYEEYLEVHSRGNKQLYHPAAGSSWRTQESTSKVHGDDSYSPSRSNKRIHHSSYK